MIVDSLDAESTQQGRQLRNDVRLRIKGALKLVQFMRGQAEQSILGEHRTGAFQGSSKHERRDILLLDARGLFDRLQRVSAETNVHPLRLLT
jgi:hypothetical protein